MPDVLYTHTLAHTMQGKETDEEKVEEADKAENTCMVSAKVVIKCSIKQGVFICAREPSKQTNPI